MSASLGKAMRVRRLVDGTGSALICAIDHGMTSPVFLSGLFDVEQRVDDAILGGANVFMAGRGVARRAMPRFTPNTSLALMLTASAAGRPAGAEITPIGSVEEALRIGADAVVTYVALAGDDETAMISYASDIGEACDSMGMPWIAEAEFPNAYQDLHTLQGEYGPAYLLRNARLCAELGADIVKVNWSGDTDSFGEIVSAAGVPVVVAGGTRVADDELLRRVHGARSVGAVGVSVGRNIFQHDDPGAITRAISRVLRDGFSAEDAYAELVEKGGAA